MNDHPVVMLTHENGNKEFCRIDYNTSEVSGSVGYTAVGGDIERARERLYPDVETMEDEFHLFEEGSTPDNIMKSLCRMIDKVKGI